MALTQAQLIALRDALLRDMASAVKSATHNGSSWTKSDFAELQAKLNFLNRMISPQASSTVFAAHDRGFPGPASWGDDGTCF
jgi:hypothetical protein